MKLDLSNHIDIQRAETYLKKLIEEGSKIELKKFVKKRTLNQQKYLYVCLKVFSDHTGYDIEESKQLFSQSLPELFYEKNGHKFRRSTSDLDTKEINTLIEKIRETCNNELGVYVVSPEEYLIHQFEIEKEYGI